jgi:hypothetical protein
MVEKANATVALTPSSLTQTYTGSALAAAATTTPSGLTVQFAYMQNGQSVTAPTNAGSYAVTATVSDANYQGSGTGTLTVAKAALAVSLQSSSNPALQTGAVTLTATLSSPGMPTGIVSFYDGTTRLASVTLSQGVATYTSSSLSVGTHSITAKYGGDSNFLDATSAALSQIVTDYTVTGGTGGSGSTTDVPTQTVQSGGTAPYSVQVAPSAGTILPADLVLTVTHNLPAGSTVVLSAAGSSGTTLVLQGGQPTPAVQLTVHVASPSAALHRTNPLSTMPFAFGFVLLPLGARLRRANTRRVRRGGLGLILILVGLAAIVGLAGCGAVNTGYAAQRNYTITVTATSGTLSHSTDFKLTVQ